ncbi:HAD superfamily hydrolase [Spiroplasma gladiatoris]|uniref:HAD superfamily hydrolase n=1 Tax=Spiroplasma gladiatoris TaxID=2143 RepID=A0A4P7AFZ0_9MOLU|nr:Cof-type HAD-IIB family hydrolase [Spiroplasma gladiatoris]QBQ07245.1 HAD superfamily hydrolase [Spiroplasma gladiatoris]
MKWWFSDYDGTINLNHNDSIDPKDLNFINRWIKQGNTFAIATGRMVGEIQDILKKAKVPYNYIICNNGAMVYEKEKGIIAKTPIPFEYRKNISEIFKELRNNFILGYCLLDQRMSYSKIYTKEVEENPFLIKYAPKKNNFEQGQKDILENPDLNLLYIYINQSEARDVKKMLQEKFKGLKVVRTHANVIEVMHKEVSKAHGILEIQKLKHFELDDVITSGDGENDIEMLALTKNSFVMKNYQPGVEEYGKHIISNVWEIEEYLKK